MSTRATIGGTLTSGRTSGTTARAVAVTAAVTATQQLLPQVADFQAWATKTGVPQLLGFVKPVLTLASGGSRPVAISVTNNSTSVQSGTVTPQLPAGFTADVPSKPYGNLAPGATGTVTFAVRNSDPSLPTANRGGVGGDYDYPITTSSSGASDTAHAALELVPTTTIPQASSTPTVDGSAEPGEYPGATLDLSRRWEGDACTSAADCSGSAQVSWSNDALYFLVHVTDDTLGKQVDPTDCKRHWRTDSVEITLDPRGTSENTSTTFKSGIFPVTSGGPACFERDADNHQGPGSDTAPGMQVAAKISSPYNGYTLEVKIPLADLPAAVDPAHLGMNILIYDSDTQDLTGQTPAGVVTFRWRTRRSISLGSGHSGRLHRTAGPPDHPDPAGDPGHRCLQPGLTAVDPSVGHHRRPPGRRPGRGSLAIRPDRLPTKRHGDGAAGPHRRGHRTHFRL
ncbi:sugar-binding protein [Fodinicola feengrottensis]|uniref:sugar-binding protein n=1 Tax=Fodinicola feengrottensis TaxID=435914 RepID=UPI00244348B5|nr:sugar-binding protein [Fodinicola feengrottensis]